MTQLSRPILDHAVINAGAALADAEQRYRALGFQLTQRGHHSLGSSNHLAILRETYLELLGVEAAKASLRRDLLVARHGLNAPVFKAADAEQLSKELKGRGAEHAEVRSFSRPVAEGGEARFRTVSLPDVEGIAGRSFFCEHQTPDRVWLPGLDEHPNGVTDIVGFLFVSDKPDTTLSHYARWFDDARIETDVEGYCSFGAGRARIVCCTSAQLESRYGLNVDCPDGQLAVMAALHFHTVSIGRLLEVLHASSIPYDRRSDGSVTVAPTDAVEVGLIFTE